MLSKIVGTFSPGTFDFLAEKIINENARESGMDVYRRRQCGLDVMRLHRTVEKGYACIRDLQGSRLAKYAQVIRVERYRWLWLGYGDTAIPEASRRFKCEYVVLPTWELGRTSFYPCKSYHPYPKRKLTKGNNRKPKGDGNMFHRNGVYPTPMFSRISP